MNQRRKLTVKFVLVLFLALVAGLIACPKAVEKVPPVFSALNSLKINLGLDLQGGIHLEYRADVSKIEAGKVDEAMQAVQDVIERRVNAFGVAEPIIYTAQSGSEQRLVVELAGLKDINDAKALIQETPYLDFREEKAEEVQQIPQEQLDEQNRLNREKAAGILKRALAGEDFAQLARENSEDPGSKANGGEYDFVTKGSFVPEYEEVIFNKNLNNGDIYPELVETAFGWHIIKRIEVRGEGETAEFKSAHILIAKKSQPTPQVTFAPTGLSGTHLKNAEVLFQSQGLGEPQVSLKFNDEGTQLFSEITKRNLGKRVAIYLDEEIISAPTVQAEITNGEAVITGNFTLDEAKQLVQRLNEGALPVPITLVSQQSVEASLGEISLQESLRAGMIGIAAVIVFMLLYYRFLGVVAAFALLLYAGLMIALFKLSYFSPWQITLTLPGIAGFILSIGMAVDANVLIFERTKEELKRGRNVTGAIDEGFKRAWTSIRDGNVSSIITAFILVEMGTGFVKGFAVTLIIGVLLSMFTAVVITKTILRFIAGEWLEKNRWLVGVKNKDK